MVPGGSDGTAPTSVVIRGAGFLARATQDGAGGLSSASFTHRAWLDDVELPGVTWVDAGTLLATVPAGFAVGPHALTVENALGLRGRLEAAFTVVVPAGLGASAAVAPPVASTGQPVTLTLTVVNVGGTAVRGLAAEVLTSGPGAVTLVSASPPVDLAAGTQVDLVVLYDASGKGDVLFDATVSGVEAFTGRALSASASAGPVRVEEAAALRGTLAIPTTLAPGAPFTAVFAVTNEGETAAVAVTPGALAAEAGSGATFSIDGGPSPGAATIAAGSTQVFTWSCTLLGTGSLRLVASAAGTDANDGRIVTTGPVTSNEAGQTLEVVPGATDPFGDGLSAGMLAVFRNQLVFGPSRNGASLGWLDPATPLSVDLSGLEIGVDLGTSRSANAAWRANPPATTIGAPGCAPGTVACGPNDEQERAVLVSGTMGGSEWMLLAGAGASQYLYLARDDPDPVPFSFLDLVRVVPPQTIAPTAALFAPALSGGPDRLYAGFACPAGNQAPVLVAITTLPPLGGLDARDGVDAVNLRADTMPRLGGGGSPANLAPSPRIDVVARFRDAIYVANNGGILRSTVPQPRSYWGNPGDWSTATPSSASYGSRASLVSTRATGLTPADRAFPAFAPFGSCGAGPCLFAARNVTGSTPAVAPQLWACDPTTSGDLAQCDPADWSLAAPNASGDAALTQLGDPANGALSVLVATPSYLYVGFDNAVTGVQLFRTDRVPSAAGDFRGKDGCAAGSPGCEGLGGYGFGSPLNRTRFLDAEVLSHPGGTSLFVLAGDGVGPSRLFELPE